MDSLSEVSPQRFLRAQTFWQHTLSDPDPLHTFDQFIEHYISYILLKSEHVTYLLLPHTNFFRGLVIFIVKIDEQHPHTLHNYVSQICFRNVIPDSVQSSTLNAKGRHYFTFSDFGLE